MLLLKLNCSYLLMQIVFSVLLQFSALLAGLRLFETKNIYLQIVDELQVVTTNQPELT